MYIFWHLDAFKSDEDPVPLFINVFERATQIMQDALDLKLCVESFPVNKSIVPDKEG
tara:strand:+ start:163 stop:333 length:171 start_codon:yes stop_codon:yes gene_type:complete